MRRRLASIGLMLLLLTACGGDGEDGKKLRIAVIPKGTTHEFWKSIHAGAVKAQRELGSDVEVIWKGPRREDDRTDQISLVENFVTSGVDAIVLAPLDDKALVDPVRLAMRRGIPVIIVDSGLDAEVGKDFTGFVATDNRIGGEIAGTRLAELLGGQGKALMLRYQEGSASTIKREAGFADAMKKADGVEFVDPRRFAGATRAMAQEASENLLAAYADVDGIFCSNESATYGMLLALRGRGLAGKKKFVGFDASEGLVKALDAGEVDGLVVQDPLAMGYLGVKAAVAAIRGESPPAFQDTGVTLVTRENRNDPKVKALLEPPLAEYLEQ